MAAVSTETGWKLWSDKEVCQNVERISDIMEERRQKYMEHFYGMDRQTDFALPLEQEGQKYDWIKRLQDISKDLIIRRPNIRKRHVSEQENKSWKALKSKEFGRKNKSINKSANV